MARKKKAAKKLTIVEHVQAAADSAAPDQAMLATELLRAFDGWMTVREYGATESKRTRELVDARFQAFKEAMEVGHATQSDQILKLGVVEQRWQDLEDAKLGRGQVLSACREQIKLSHQKIKDLVSELKQPSLFGPGFGAEVTIDNPPIPEEDDEETDDDLDDA